jgi:hypothetical protein
MKFTAQELNYLAKLTRRLAKNRKHWLWVRWLFLAGALVIMGAAIYNFYLLRKVLDTFSSALSLPNNEYKSEMLRLFIEGNIEELRIEVFFLFKIALQEIVGLGLLIYCMRNWNLHIRNEVIMKLIREITSENRIE